MTDLGPALDAARREVAERGLVPDAVTQLNDVVRALPPDALTPVKQHLKRFFSDAAWTAADDDGLADLVGGGTGGGEHELAPGLTLTWRWVERRFRLRVERAETPDDPWSADEADLPEATDLEASFDGPVVPEATPSPRTIRFSTPAVRPGPSRSYESVDDASGDRRVARLFGDFAAVTSVLVGPDFVAVSLDRPGSWESLLAPVLAAVTEGFVAEPRDAEAERGPQAAPESAPVTRTLGVGVRHDDVARPRHLERAWAELGGLDPGRPRDLDRVLAASEDDEPARRQVAATLLADAPHDLATRVWSRLLTDPSRVVRRSVVDAMVGAGWPDVRALLENALDDADPWVRWKALKGIVQLGAAPSRSAVETRRDDPDFRVRLEVAAALRQRA